MKNKEVEKKSKVVEQDEIKKFTPPKDSTEPKVCYKHPDEEAFTVCSNCGKYICRDCAESCAVSGEDDGKVQYLCYDCCEKMFTEQEKKLKKDKSKIAFQFALTIIGVIIGAALGADGGIFGVIMFAAIGGAFLSAIKPIASSLGDIMKGVFELASGGSIMEAIVNFIVGIFKFLLVAVQCCFKTISKLISYIKYLNSANKAIKETQQALQQLADFMQYMEIREKSKNFDLDALLSDEGSTLFNNSYARALKDEGEEAADQMLRRATTTIAENGEIIRNFAV